eukprot:s2527_g4.t1
MFAFLEVIWLTAKMMLPPSRPFMPMGGPMGGPINPMGGLPGMPSMPQPGTVPGVLPQPGLPQTILPQPGLPSPGMCQGAPGTLLPQPAMAQTLPTPQLPGTVPQPFAGVGVLPRPPMNPGMCANTMPPRPLQPMPPMGAGMPGGCPAPRPMGHLALPSAYKEPSLPPRPPAGSLPQQLAQLAAAGSPQDPSRGPSDRKPQLYMLIAQLATHVEESHMQQILEQCGDIQAFRRGQDAEGRPMSFGVAQFADAESAWKAFTCLNKRRLAGQEIKVLLEENTEQTILRWKTSQKAVYHVNSDEELEWELERTAVSCKALLDSKIEELYGASDVSGGAAAQRRKELREREQKRVDRARKRKAWREAEFGRELDRLQAAEKRLRDEERERDDADREKEDQEVQEKQRKELKLEKLEAEDGLVRTLNVAQLADNRALMQMVEKVQEEPREELFTMKLDTAYLRNERLLERKLRPWLERKIDLYMGGQTSDLVELVIRRVNGAVQPDPLIAELERFLDEYAEPLVERLWRMLALEMMQNGIALPSVVKRQKKEELKEEK